MPSESPKSFSDDSRLNQIIAEYLKACQAGNSPDRQQLLRDHPECADSLKAFFANHDDLRGSAHDSQELPTIAPSGSSEDATIVPSSTSDPPPIGTRVRYFGDYELLEEIARGGMGVVYKARQTKLNRIVALKMILAGQFAGESDVRRFHAEAEAAAQLDHPGIVPIFEVGEHEGQHYFSMGFVDGGSLADKIKDGPLPPREAAEYVKKIAEAVAYAHEKGVIHRDLKPGNVLLDATGEPKVTDFGMAKRVEGDSSLTATGQILGTPSYMPPEQASGRTDEIDEAADVYSLGAILYALITGRPPFQADNPIDTLMQVLERDPIPVRMLGPHIAEDLETICSKCLEKRKQARYSSAAVFAADLRRWINHEPIFARPISDPEKIWRWSRRKPLAASLVLTLFLLVLISSTATWWAFRQVKYGRTQAANLAMKVASDLGARGNWDESMLWYAKAYAETPIGRPELRDVAARNLAWTTSRVHHLAGDFSLRDNGRLFLSADGRYVANGATRDHIQVRDLGSGELLFRGPRLDKTIGFAKFSPDSRTVILSTLARFGYESSFWSVDTGLAIGSVLTPNPRRWDVLFSPDSSLVAAISNGVDIWDTQTAELIKTLPISKVDEIAFSANSEMLALLRDRNELLFLDPRTGATQFEALKIERLQGGEPKITLLRGNELLVELRNGKRTSAHLWNVASQKELWLPASISEACVLSKDGKLIAVSQENGQVQVWNRTERKPVGPTLAHGREVRDLQFNLNGELLLAATESDWQIWDFRRGVKVGQPIHEGRIEYLRFSNDQVLCVANVPGAGQSARVWRIASLPEEYRPIDYEIQSTIVSRHPDGIELHQRARGIAWETPAGQRLGFIKMDGQVVRRMFDTTKGYLAVTNDQSEVGVARIHQETGRGIVVRHSGPIHSVCFSSNHTAFATASEDQTARLWDLTNGRPLSPPLEHKAAVVALNLSPDGRLLATADRSGQVYLWDARFGNLIGQPRQLPAQIEEVVLTESAAIAVDVNGTKWELPTPLTLDEDGRRVLRWAELTLAKSIDETGGLSRLPPGIWQQKRRHAFGTNPIQLAWKNENHGAADVVQRWWKTYGFWGFVLLVPTALSGIAWRRKHTGRRIFEMPRAMRSARGQQVLAFLALLITIYVGLWFAKWQVKQGNVDAFRWLLGGMALLFVSSILFGLHRRRELLARIEDERQSKGQIRSRVAVGLGLGVLFTLLPVLVFSLIVGVPLPNSGLGLSVGLLALLGSGLLVKTMNRRLAGSRILHLPKGRIGESALQLRERGIILDKYFFVPWQQIEKYRWEGPNRDVLRLTLNEAIFHSQSRTIIPPASQRDAIDDFLKRLVHSEQDQVPKSLAAARNRVWIMAGTLYVVMLVTGSVLVDSLIDLPGK